MKLSWDENTSYGPIRSACLDVQGKIHSAQYCTFDSSLTTTCLRPWPDIKHFFIYIKLWWHSNHPSCSAIIYHWNKSVLSVKWHWRTRYNNSRTICIYHPWYCRQQICQWYVSVSFVYIYWYGTAKSKEQKYYSTMKIIELKHSMCQIVMPKLCKTFKINAATGLQLNL